jgi:hypothetical protein
MLGVQPGGSWRDELRHVVTRIRESTDPAFVLVHLSHPNGLVRLTAVEWIVAHDAQVRSLQPVAELLRRDPRILTDTLASQLLPDDVIGELVAAHVSAPAPLVEYLLNTPSNSSTGMAATCRILELGALDELLDAATPERPLPPFADFVLADRCTRADVLESLLPHGLYHRTLLGNPALTDDQRRFILARMEPWQVPGSAEEQEWAARGAMPTDWTVPDPGAPIAVHGYPIRADGDPTTWAAALTIAADWLTDHSDIADPGGFEASELRSCGPAGAGLFVASVPLCREAVRVLFDPHPLSGWGESAVTWAVELASVGAGLRSLYPRLGIARGQLSRTDLQDIPADVLRSASTAARTAARDHPAEAPLGEAVALLLDALAAGGGSLPCLRNYGAGNGYDGYHLYAILALRTVVPVLHALNALAPPSPTP